MTDLEGIAYFLNEGEIFASARMNHKYILLPKDVYHIKHLGKPTGSNIDFFYRAWASTAKRLIASDVEDACDWVKYFNRANAEFMEIDDHTFVFAKDF